MEDDVVEHLHRAAEVYEALRVFTPHGCYVALLAARCSCRELIFALVSLEGRAGRELERDDMPRWETLRNIAVHLRQLGERSLS